MKCPFQDNGRNGELREPLGKKRLGKKKKKANLKIREEKIEKQSQVFVNIPSSLAVVRDFLYINSK